MYPSITKVNPISNFKVYVNNSEFFYSNLPKISDYVNIKKVPPKFNKELSYYAAICGTYVATYLCGVSTHHTSPHDDVNPIITSIMNFHIYLWVRRFVKNPDLLQQYSGNLRAISGNIPVKGHWDVDKYSDTKASIGIVYRRFKNEHRTVRNVRPARNASGRVVGLSYDELVGITSLASASDYMRYYATKSTGLVDTSLIQESLQCYVYCVLGAQANTRWAIVDRGTSSLLTQKGFRQLVEDMVVQTDLTVGISNMRIAIRDTNAIVNTAINPDIILFPSNL
ncbi:Hypothetical predicted protein, partial [Paramuricea clavata]